MKRILAVALALALGACAEGGGIKRPSDRPFENWEKGAVLGAAAGAGLGAIAYSKNRSTGAIYGAVGGGLAGAAAKIVGDLVAATGSLNYFALGRERVREV